MASPPKIFITCQGTRGDVQPYLVLSAALQERGWLVLFGAPPEFQSFAKSYGISSFVDLGPAPSQTMYEETVSDGSAGRAHRSLLSRPFAAFSQAKHLFNPAQGTPFTQLWFRRIFKGCRDFRPDVLILVFTSWSGAAAIPSLLDIPTRVILSYPMPMAPTGEFAVSMAGIGFSLPFAWMNRLQWAASDRMIVQRIHLPAARRNLATIIEEEAAAGRALPGAATTRIDHSLNVAGLPALFAFSPSLLPKPADWPAYYRVIGQLQHRDSSADAYKPLPTALQAYLNASYKKNMQVVYIGFGSLGFFPPEKVTAILDAVAEAVRIVVKTFPNVRAIMQTALSSTPGKTGALSAAQQGVEEPFFTFSESVDHSALFPLTSLVVSHGGIGTVQAALNAGKPVLSMCCLPTADQSFWADLCHRRGLGPQWFWVNDLTPQRMADGILVAMRNLDRFTSAAESLARDMSGDDAVKAALGVLEEEVAVARSGAKQ